MVSNHLQISSGGFSRRGGGVLDFSSYSFTI